MNAILVDNIEYPLPNDFTLSQWRELNEIGFNRKKELIASAFGVPLEQLEGMSDSAADLGARIIYTTLFPADAEPNTDGLKSFKDMTIGQFIDLEVYLGEGANKTITNIANILYENEITDETPISQVWGAFQSYMNYRTLLYKQYEGLLGGGGDDDEVVENKPVNKRDTAHNWYNTIMFVANDDLLKANQVVERPVIEVFNYLAYRKTKYQAELQRLRQQQQEAKYKR